MIDGEQWTEVFHAGTGHHQPIFHIDMFVSLAGRSPQGVTGFSSGLRRWPTTSSAGRSFPTR